MALRDTKLVPRTPAQEPQKVGREYKLISSKLEAMLIKQLAHELKNYNLYNSFANFYGLKGLADLEEYFSKRAVEEKNHHDWILKFLSDGDSRVKYPVIESNSEQDVSDIITPFKSTIKREIETTQMLYAIYEAAQAERDYMTSTWLYEKLIKEQIEEENTSRMALDIMNLDADLLNRCEKVLELLEG